MASIRLIHTLQTYAATPTTSLNGDISVIPLMFLIMGKSRSKSSVKRIMLIRISGLCIRNSWEMVSRIILLWTGLVVSLNVKRKEGMGGRFGNLKRGQPRSWRKFFDYYEADIGASNLLCQAFFQWWYQTLSLVRSLSDSLRLRFLFSVVLHLHSVSLFISKSGRGGRAQLVI